MNSYLRCTASPGQFSWECAIRGKAYNGVEFSLFVPKDYVKLGRAGEGGDPNNALLSVEVVETDDKRALVRLPMQTFENGRTVTVSRDLVEGRDPGDRRQARDATG